MKSKEYEITKELVDKAIELGWQIVRLPKHDKYLSNMMDLSEEWDTKWIMFEYGNEEVLVPHWLKRRIDELQ